jgi:uncharacterized membrane protein
MILFGIAIKRKLFFQLLCYTSLIYFSYLMVLITIQYIPVRFDVAFLRIKQEEIKYLHYQISFFTHVYSSIFVLILGSFQFSDYVRKKYSKVHKALGKIYISLVLFFAGPTGLVMGYYANGGWIAQTSFCLLAILWMAFTYKAYIFARRKKWEQHKNYMYRSYALTLSAISLRLFKWIIASLFELPPMDTYIIVAWLGWVLNLLLAELIIYFRPGPAVVDLRPLT